MNADQFDKKETFFVEIYTSYKHKLKLNTRTTRQREIYKTAICRQNHINAEFVKVNSVKKEKYKNISYPVIVYDGNVGNVIGLMTPYKHLDLIFEFYTHIGVSIQPVIFVRDDLDQLQRD